METTLLKYTYTYIKDSDSNFECEMKILKKMFGHHMHKISWVFLKLYKLNIVLNYHELKFYKNNYFIF